MRLRRYIFIFTLSTLQLIALSAQAESIIELIGLDGPAFIIDVPGNKSLTKLLTEELTHQQTNNLELKQYTHPSKIARFEKELLIKRLRAEGYYAAKVSSDITGKKPIYRVNAGEAYHIKTLELRADENIKLPSKLTKLKLNDTLNARVVLQAQEELIAFVRSNNCLLEVNTNYDAIVHHDTRTASLMFNVIPSPQVTVNNITFSGLDKIDPLYMDKLVLIEKNACFKRHELSRLRLELLQTNLLTSVDTKLTLVDDNKVNIDLIVTERAHRSISTGAGYESDEGLGVSLGWESRNLWGNAEKLALGGRFYESNQNISAALTLPHFYKKNQIVTLFADLEQTQTDAFDSSTGLLGAEITRQVRTHLKARIGADIDFSEITETNENPDQVALISAPVSLEYDKRDDELNPRSGWIGAARVRPYWDWYEQSTRFIKTTLAISAYKTFYKTRWQPTLAVRSATGSISGLSKDDIPASIRFYSGGGGSVRGYSFQSIGPYDEDDEPDGGLSLTELSFEARLRFSQHWGAVLFTDGGAAYDEKIPQWGQDVKWSVGLGIRYYTSFAPIRFDIALPVNDRDTLEDPFQVYISIGQAF